MTTVSLASLLRAMQCSEMRRNQIAAGVQEGPSCGRAHPPGVVSVASVIGRQVWIGRLLKKFGPEACRNFLSLPATLASKHDRNPR